MKHPMQLVVASSLGSLLLAACATPPSSKAPDAARVDAARSDAGGEDAALSDGLTDAPTCGITGRVCCETGAPCLAPNAACSEDNRCELSIECGAEGQDCCDGLCNSPDLLCISAGGMRLRCVPCGDVGENCCAEGACNGSSCCVEGLCIAEGTTCIEGDKDFGACAAGKCQGCGAIGQPCCPGLNDRCQEGVCPAGVDPVCTACGETGQPCCTFSVCSSGCCDKDRLCIADGTPCGGGSCNEGSCGSCGGLGQPCCDPHATLFCAESNTRCDGQFCVAAP